jgi:hypothetical protein
MTTIGTTAIPSDQITVIGGGTTSVSAAFESTVGMVGGMDTSNGTANTGEVTQVRTPTDAEDAFGQDSELANAATLAIQNGASLVYAYPVEETTVSAETQSAQDGTLDNVPFDPRVNPEHSISVSDSGGGSVDVSLVDSPPSSAPSEADTVEVYPPTGEYYADAAPSGSNYEFSYDYGDYSTSALAAVVDESPRIVVALSETPSVISDLDAEVGSNETNFDLMHALGGGEVGVSSDTANASTPVTSDRMSVLGPSRGYLDAAETEQARTTAAVAGELAGIPLGLSSTNNSIAGFQSLVSPLSGPVDAGELIDNGFMPLLDYGGNDGVVIVKDMTTSDEPKFERVYSNQITDEVVTLLHEIARDYVGEPNTDGERANLRRSVRNMLNGLEGSTPPLLDDSVASVSQSDSDDNAVDVTIGISPVGVMDTIKATVVVGDIVRNEGTA